MNTKATAPLREKDYQVLNYLNIDDYHKAGYTGKGVKFCELESGNDHCEAVIRTYNTLDKDMEVYNMGMSIISKNGEYVSGNIDKVAKFIRDNNIKIIGVSLGTGHATRKVLNTFKELINEGRIMVVAAGNEGTGKDTINGFCHEIAVSIGAVSSLDGFKTINKTYYSSTGKELDFVMFLPLLYSGTSFSAPFMSGMIALLLDRYGDLNQEEIYALLQAISRDLGEEGFDEMYGYGLPILPPLDSDLKVVRMFIDNLKYTVNKKEKVMDTKPVIVDNRTCVPIRFVSQELGYAIQWDSEEYKITISNEVDVVEMWIGKKEYKVNGNVFMMDTPPFIQDNRTMIPLRFLVESLGAKIVWTEKQNGEYVRMVTIIK